MHVSFLEAKETGLAEESVHASIGLSSSSHAAAEGEGLLLAVELSVLVDVSNFDLHGGVVGGGDKSVGSRALSGDVQVNNLSLFVLHFVYTSKTSLN